MPHGTIAIIGTAGRKDDAARIDAALYDAMYAASVDAVSEWKTTRAASGGAAVADHLAVRAYLEGAVEQLTLFLPAPFENGAFLPTPNLRFNPGSTIQKYHLDFSRRCDIDSLGELSRAIEKGADVRIHPGFHARNIEVADVPSHLLAFTFGSGETADFGPDDAGFRKSGTAGLKDGGTAHTWEQCWKADRKRHVDLFALKSAMVPDGHPVPRPF